MEYCGGHFYASSHARELASFHLVLSHTVGGGSFTRDTSAHSNTLPFYSPANLLLPQYPPAKGLGKSPLTFGSTQDRSCHHPLRTNGTLTIYGGGKKLRIFTRKLMDPTVFHSVGFWWYLSKSHNFIEVLLQQVVR